jgi:hypothetical protein
LSWQLMSCIRFESPKNSTLIATSGKIINVAMRMAITWRIWKMWRSFSRKIRIQHIKKIRKFFTLSFEQFYFSEFFSQIFFAINSKKKFLWIITWCHFANLLWRKSDDKYKSSENVKLMKGWWEESPEFFRCMLSFYFPRKATSFFPYIAILLACALSHLRFFPEAAIEAGLLNLLLDHKEMTEPCLT